MGIYYKEWLESKWRLIAGILVLCGFSLLNVVFYPWLKTMMTPEMMTLLETLMKNFPIAIPEGAFAVLDWNTYLFGSWISKTLYQTMTVYILIISAPLLASEESRGTMEFLLAKPITSLQVISAKYLVNVLEMILVVLASTIILYPASLLMKESFNLSLFSKGLLQAFPGYIFLFSLAFFISALFKDSIKALAFTAVTFFILSIPSFIPDYRHLSIYRFMQGINILKGEGILFKDMFLLLAVSLVLFVLSYYIFNKKEV